MKITIDTENVEDLKELASEIAKAIKIAEEKDSVQEKPSRVVPKDIIYLDSGTIPLLLKKMELEDVACGWVEDNWVTQDVLVEVLKAIVDKAFTEYNSRSSLPILEAGSVIEFFEENETWECDCFELAYKDENIVYYDVNNNGNLEEVKIS